MNIRNICLPAIIIMAGFGCAGSGSTTPSDIFSFANTDEFRTEHLHLDLAVDFDNRVLRGSATLRIRRIAAVASSIVLDTRDLSIAGTDFLSDTGEAIEAEHRFGDADDVLGTPLVVSVPARLRNDEELTLRVDYHTSPEASALQWLPPELTSGGKHPFLFSQSQAIHARSWVPLQDTPVVRITYTASIRTPPDLLAVMSADNDPDAKRTGAYYFEMPQPVPSYLLAIAVGDIYFAPIGDRTGVYAEPEIVDAAAFEFADTQKMLETAEAMFGPYRWDRYDLLILPPSFPYGGMENPRLSFLTPSLIAGDRSLVSVVAHELAHSWSGNLVTNATWRDSWLNEGCTSYLEHRLMQVIYGDERAAEENVLGYQELLLDFEDVKPEFQALAPNLDTVDEEDFQGTVAYHKGSLFLQYLEQAFGRDVFDAFIGKYFEEFAFRSITSEQFLDYLDEQLLSARPGIVSRAKAEEWLYQPGLPDDAVIPSSANLDGAEKMAHLWSQGEIDIADIPRSVWSPQATIHFINSLDADLSTEQLIELDEAMGLSSTRNAAIGKAWFIQVARRRHHPAYDQLGKYLRRYGRIWLIRPIYAALAQNGSDFELATELFTEARDTYHPLTNASIESALQRATKSGL